MTIADKEGFPGRTSRMHVRAHVSSVVTALTTRKGTNCSEVSLSDVNFRVVSGTSAFGFKGAKEDIYSLRNLRFLLASTFELRVAP